jgi:hypothetical protein
MTLVVQLNAEEIAGPQEAFKQSVKRRPWSRALAGRRIVDAAIPGRHFIEQG